MKKSGIYQIINLVNNKIYVGQSICLERRFDSHLRDLRNQRHCNEHLQRAFDKYGEDAFRFEVLEVVYDKELLDEREQYYLDSYPKEYLYNIYMFASSPRGRTLTEEQKEKIRIWHRTLPPEFYKRSGLARRGQVRSDETKKKMSKSKKGRKPSEHAIALTRLKTQKPVMQIDIGTGEIISIFDSLTSAEFWTKIDSGNISKACDHKRKTAGKFRWEYVDN